MTIREWHQSFQVQADTLAGEGFERLQPEIVDLLLNKSIDTLIQKAYDEFEESQKIADLLSNQLLSLDSTFNKLSDGKYQVALPVNYYFHIQSNATAKIGDKEGLVSTRKGLLDDESKEPYYPYTSPDGMEFPIYFKEGGITVYTGVFTLTKFNILYLKKPIVVAYNSNTSSDIHPALHNKIIEHAVLLALETYSSERFQSKGNLNNV